MKTIRTDIIPTTARQAFKILDEMVTFEKAIEYLSGTKGAFQINEHMGLGMSIRNNWLSGYDGEQEEIIRRRDACYKMLAGVKDEYGLLPDNDEVAFFFLGRYYDHLKRKYPQEVRNLSYEEYLQRRNSWSGDMPQLLVDEVAKG